jgi:hypothetical protein
MRTIHAFARPAASAAAAWAALGAYRGMCAEADDLSAHRRLARYKRLSRCRCADVVLPRTAAEARGYESPWPHMALAGGAFAAKYLLHPLCAAQNEWLIAVNGWCLLHTPLRDLHFHEEYDRRMHELERERLEVQRQLHRAAVARARSANNEAE